MYKVLYGDIFLNKWTRCCNFLSTTLEICCMYICRPFMIINIYCRCIFVRTWRSLKRFFISKCISFVFSYGNFSTTYNNLWFSKEVHWDTSRFKSQVTLLMLLLSLCSFTYQQLKERIKTIASLPISKTYEYYPEVIQLTGYYVKQNTITVLHCQY